MATHWTVGIISVMFLIVAQEFGGTVMMTISTKLAIYQGFIIERLTNPRKKAFNDGFLKGTVGSLYQNKPLDKIIAVFCQMACSYINNRQYL